MPNYITDPADLPLNEREEIIHFIGKPPSYFLRFGITAVAGAMGIFLGLSCLIHYPDTARAKVVLTTERPPIHVLAKAGGRVAELLVVNNQIVASGEVLATLENAGNWRDVLRLERVMRNEVLENTSTWDDLGILNSARTESKYP